MSTSQGGLRYMGSESPVLGSQSWVFQRGCASGAPKLRQGCAKVAPSLPQPCARHSPPETSRTMTEICSSQPDSQPASQPWNDYSGPSGLKPWSFSSQRLMA